MSNLRLVSSVIARCATALGLVLLSACAKTALPAVGSLSPTDQISLREPLARAASISMPEFEAITQSPTAPRLDSLGGKNHPFTLVLLALRPEAVDADLEKLEAELPIGKVPPSEIFHHMVNSQPAGYASMIQAEAIQLVDGQISLDKSIPVARGFVQYRIAENSSASVEYEARFENGVWNVIRYTMPAWQAQTVKQPDGTWLASGPALRAQYAQLPQVTGQVAPRDTSAGRFIVEFRVEKSDQPNPASIRIQVGTEPRELTLAEFQKESPRLVKEFEAAGNSRQTAVFVIRADKVTPLSLIESLTVSATQHGFKKFALAAMAKGDAGNTLGDLPFAGPDLASSAGDEAMPFQLIVRADGDGKLQLNMGDLPLREDNSLDALVSRLTDIQKLAQANVAPRIVVRGSHNTNASHLAEVLSSTPALAVGNSGQGLLVVGQPELDIELSIETAPTADISVEDVTQPIPSLDLEPLAAPPGDIGAPGRTEEQKRNDKR